MKGDITSISKNAFMVIDKENAHKKKSYYNFFMYKLKEDKPENGILSYNQKPIFKGMVQFERIGTENDSPLEVVKLWKRINLPDLRNLAKDMTQNLQPLNPRLFKIMFINVSFIVIPVKKNESYESGNKREEEKEELALIYEIAEKYQNIEIRRYELCSYCREKKKFTLLGKNQWFIGQNKQKICKNCAGINLLKILAKDYEIKVSPALKLLMSRKLMKFKSVPKVVKMFASNFNPLTNRDLTLYDIKKETKSLLKTIQKIKKIHIRNLKIPNILKDYYHFRKISELLPIQVMAVENQLFFNKNMLVSSSTSSGKTMLGELAGFKKILENKQKKLQPPEGIFKLKGKKNNEKFKSYISKLLKTRSGRKMLYLVPIVALASLRYEEYKALRKFGINPALKVGRSFMENELASDLGSVGKADLIIATYEAIDVILRSGGSTNLGSVGTIVIDEIQMLNDPERGWILDGMIARLRFVYPKAQIIFLSATISDAPMLAKHYNSNLVELKGRPVKIERHLIILLNDFEKQKSILLLADEEFKKKSSFGFKGQTLVFTNSRRKCHNIAKFLSDNGVSAEAYHGGLLLEERRNIEYKFSKQIISTVVSTAALAAGIDFAVNQVIFESLAMGIKWLSVADFEQMSGRAGRYRKHDLGKVVILVQPGKSYSAGQLDGEERIVLHLLKGKIESIKLDPNEEKMFTEINAFISMRSRNVNVNDLTKYQKFLVNNNFNLKSCVNYLGSNKFLVKTTANELKITPFGKASAESFFSVYKCVLIRESLKKGENLLDLEESDDSSETEKQKDTVKPVLNPKFRYDFDDNLPVILAMELNPFKNIYLSNSLVREISGKGQKSRSSLLFNNSTLSLINAEHLGSKRKLSKVMRDLLILWTSEIFNCGCKDSPYCNCGRKNIEKKIISLRLEGYYPNEIMKWLESEWYLKIYSGDLYDYIDGFIHNLRSIYKIGKSMIRSLDEESTVKNDINKLPNFIKNLKVK